MKPNEVKIPVASHGLHNHKFNYPYGGTFNFMDVCPVYCEPLKKGESSKPLGNVFARLNAVTNPAFATGRFNFKAFFVPFKYVYSPWYALQEQSIYPYSEGTHQIPASAPFTTYGALSEAFVTNTDFVERVVGTPNNQNTDLVFLDSDNGPNYFKVTPLGASVLKVLNSCGLFPSWTAADTKQRNILWLLCYCRVFLDYYWPNQYYGTLAYNTASGVIRRESNDYSGTTWCTRLLALVAQCCSGFYDDSIFDAAFDKPVGYQGYNDPSIVIPDITNNVSTHQVVTNSPTGAPSPSNAANRPNNGTPFIGSTGSSSTTTLGTLTQYVLDALQSLNNFVQRHRLAGGRLLNRFLVDRGLAIDHDYTQTPYYLGQRDIEINIDAVYNNSDQNLGEMAGRGIASSGDKPLNLQAKRVQDDGVFIVVVFVKPDCDLLVASDPWNDQVSSLDFHHSEFDKVGPVNVPVSAISMTNNGVANSSLNLGQFGFLNRYYAEVINRGKLVGDFRLSSRGGMLAVDDGGSLDISGPLGSYYTFRDLNYWIMAHNAAPVHSWSFVNSAVDKMQYQRLFYSEKVDNMQLFIRWTGENKKFKLPLGDSYDWDEDEFNEKVTVVNSGQTV